MMPCKRSPLTRPARRSARPSHRGFRGFTLIELILVLSVGSMITLLSFQGMKRATESNQARIVGQQMQTVGQAVDTYIAARYTQISQLSNAAGTAADPGPRTCTGTTCTITVATLVNEGLLPVTYKNLNSFGSGYTISMNVTGTTPNLNVNGVVTTTSPWTLGGVVRYDLLGQAMAAAGSDSGMTQASATRIDGYGGVWNAPLSTGTGLGLLGFQVGTGSTLYSVYLRRDGTLPMTGDLNMNDGVAAHNIYNASNITGNGRFTSAQNYSSYVNLAGNLDMAGTATITGNANVTGNASVAGTVFANAMTNYGAGYIGNGLTVVNGQNLASGNLNIANGSITMVNGGQINNSGTGYFETAGNLYLKPWNANGVTVVGGGGGSGQLLATGNITSQQYLIPQGGAGVGGGCGPNGAIGTDGTQALFCKNGAWASAIPGQNSYVSVDLGNGGVFGVPSGTTRVDGYVMVTWTGSNAGVAEFVVRDTSGNIQNYFYGGLYGWNDGGSGSQWWFPVSIPVVSNTASIQMVQINGSNAITWHVGSYTQ